MQRNFVAVVSHEFRTALTSIQGFSGLMSEEILSPAEVKEYATDIFSEANRLARMITDLLDTPTDEVRANGPYLGTHRFERSDPQSA